MGMPLSFSLYFLSLKNQSQEFSLLLFLLSFSLVTNLIVRELSLEQLQAVLLTVIVLHARPSNVQSPGITSQLSPRLHLIVFILQPHNWRHL